MNDSKNDLKEGFKDKDYRHGYVDEFLNAWIATQIKVLREQRGWSQEELAQHAGMRQPRISALENVNYSSWSIGVLRKLAEAFDLALCVSFESFGTRADDIEGLSRTNLERHSFPDDPYFQEKRGELTTLPDKKVVYLTDFGTGKNDNLPLQRGANEASAGHYVNKASAGNCVVV